MAISPITFDWAGPTSADHGRLFEKILGDGILFGCSINYAGQLLTIGAGHIIACGRLMKLTDAEQLTIEAVSGFARVLVQVDMDNTTTTEIEGTVVQVVQPTLITQTASTLSGFSALEQEDINGTGKVYQVLLCVVSCNNTGITEVVYTAPVATDSVVELAKVGMASLDTYGKVTATQVSSSIRVESNSFTVGAEHAGKLINCNNNVSGQNITITFPITSDLPIGTELEVWRSKSGGVIASVPADAYLCAVGVATTAGASVKISDKYGVAAFKRISNDTWLASGNVEKAESG